MKKNLHFFAILFVALPFFVSAQTYKLPKDQKFQKIKFELVNNLMIIPVEVNGSDLKFVLDSGVSRPILFNLSDTDSIQINNVSEVTINGLGDGEPIKALSSMGNSFKLGKARNYNQGLYVVLDKE
ncbi:MAG: retropepsin-like aspartic protease, partial [Allomuricauda sp.]